MFLSQFGNYTPGIPKWIENDLQNPQIESLIAGDVEVGDRGSDDQRVGQRSRLRHHGRSDHPPEGLWTLQLLQP